MIRRFLTPGSPSCRGSSCHLALFPGRGRVWCHQHVFSGKASLRNSCPHPFSCVNTAAGELRGNGDGQLGHIRRPVWWESLLYLSDSTALLSVGYPLQMWGYQAAAGMGRWNGENPYSNLASRENTITSCIDGIPTLHGFLVTYSL